MAEPYRILSLDGGGIRGIIPAVVLAEIEKHTAKRISELFDLIVGTSTGGILALGLVKPDDKGDPALSAEDLVDLYQQEGQHIFARSLWHEAAALGNLLDEKYPAGGLERVLDEYFGETMLSQAVTDVLITSYELESRSAWFFKSHKARTNPEFDYKMKDVGRATSAAPTYFEPAWVPTAAPPDHWAMIDGGVFANNPTMCGVAEAFNTRVKQPLVVISLGTGSQIRTLPYTAATGWGLAGWARPILDVVFDGVNDTVDYQVKQICSATDEVSHYFRLQTTLDIANDDMDDASEHNIHQLKLLGDRIVQNDPQFAQVLTALGVAAPALV